MMTALDVEFKRALHYHDGGHESDNDYELPPWMTGPICVYSVFTTEASFNPTDFTTAQHTISPFTPRCPRNLSFWEGVCWCLHFDEMPLMMPETDSDDDKEPLPTADLENPAWDEELVPDNREYLCIHEIPRMATPTLPKSLHQWPLPCSPTKESQPCCPSCLTP